MLHSRHFDLIQIPEVNLIPINRAKLLSLVELFLLGFVLIIGFRVLPIAQIKLHLGINCRLRLCMRMAPVSC